MNQPNPTGHSTGNLQGSSQPTGPADTNPAETIHRVVDNRYRSSRYFLEDQLRYSEAVNDFRSVRNFINSSPQFSLRRAFAFVSE